jgi:glycosyltransferase involved in cell wall biosynthesis
MPPTPLVTVIIPTRNSGDYLAETLQSVRDQTYPHFECHLIDGNSTDSTRTIARQFAAQDLRFRLLDQKPSPPGFRAVSLARNQGLAAARGELIAFLDADDVWHPEKLARQIELFQDHPEIHLAYTNYHYWDGQKNLGLRYEKPRQYPIGDYRVLTYYSCCFGFSSVLMRRDLLEKIGGFDETLSDVEDWDLWLRLAAHGFQAQGLTEPLLQYRVHTTNASRDFVRVSEFVVAVLEKNRPPADAPRTLWRHYQSGLQQARSRLQLAIARRLLDTDPKKVPAALWRTWWLYPYETKWLLRSLLITWPQWLGGAPFQTMVRKKLRAKF